MDQTPLEKQLHKETAAFWVTKGEENALHLFHEAATRVPAYKDFLKKANIDPSIVKTMDDFRHVPLTTRADYIATYSTKERSWDGRLDLGNIIAESSGTTGTSFFWPRTVAHEKEVASIHKALFDDFFGAAARSTLYVNCFHMGAHIAGLITANAIARMFEEGAKGALVNPGLNQKDILRCVSELGKEFDQVVLIGYPPFIKDVLDAGITTGIDWKAHQVKYFFAAEAFPEHWRDHLYNICGLVGEERVSVNVYGSADLGFIAHETSQTIALRNKMQDDVELNEQFGGIAMYVPPIFQYNPSQRYLEVIDGNIVCTADAGLPMIRYDIKDRGVIVPFEDAPDYGVQQGWQLPYVSVLGRRNYSTTIYGLNIYPEHIRDILAEEDLVTSLSGKFFSRQSYDADKNQMLEIHVELNPGIEITDTLIQHIHDILLSSMQRMNLEYGKFIAAVGEKGYPHIYAHAYGSSEFKAAKMKQSYFS